MKTKKVETIYGIPEKDFIDILNRIEDHIEDKYEGIAFYVAPTGKSANLHDILIDSHPLAQRIDQIVMEVYNGGDMVKLLNEFIEVPGYE